MADNNTRTVVNGLNPTVSGKVQAVLFADIAGSTKLYDTLGDKVAKQMVDGCIEVMSSVVRRNGGRVVKTIGDEVMCVLPSADSACVAASDMQLKISEMPSVSGIQRAIRVGFHVGVVIEENNDVFGDTVNLAARMAGLAKATQIITTRSAVDRMSPALRGSTRPIAALSVKGKGDDVDVCEVIWQASSELTMAPSSIMANTREVELKLKHGAQDHHLAQGNAAMVLGRDAACQIVVADRMASRQHARVERRQNKIYLADQSTNGTFVVFDGGNEVILRREEVMLSGSGRIAFGHGVGDTSDEVVEFTVRN